MFRIYHYKIKIEIIHVDDCSTDNSLKIMENYQKNDNRIILLKNPYNYGKIKSRSNAVKLEKGRYILVLDGDDGLATRDILNIVKEGFIWWETSFLTPKIA